MQLGSDICLALLTFLRVLHQICSRLHYSETDGRAHSRGKEGGVYSCLNFRAAGCAIPAQHGLRRGEVPSLAPVQSQTGQSEAQDQGGSVQS